MQEQASPSPWAAMNLHAAQAPWHSVWNQPVGKKEEQEVGHLLAMTLEPF
jgi:hypothetical protein